MSQFNLVDDPWIRVFDGNANAVKTVSLHDVFAHASDYRCLAGDTRTQDFTVLRMLEAVLTSVFSRVDADGKPYPMVPLNDKGRQTADVAEEDKGAYAEAATAAWKALWKRKDFGNPVAEYLEREKDRFELFGGPYPFMQATESTIRKEAEKYGRGSGSELGGKLIGRYMNRTVLESGNQVNPFSYLPNDEKDAMTADEFIRWLIAYQGYAGTVEKRNLAAKDPNAGEGPKAAAEPEADAVQEGTAEGGKKKEKKYSVPVSTGTLTSLGGIYLEGNDLFETLMMDFVPLTENKAYWGRIQRPCWERPDTEVIERRVNQIPYDNLAELYTGWARVFYVDPDLDLGHVLIGSTKLPKYDRTDTDLEPMTIWWAGKVKEKGEGGIEEERTIRVPTPFNDSRRMWERISSFMPGAANGPLPKVLTSYVDLTSGDAERNRTVVLQAVSIQLESLATSQKPINELLGTLRVSDRFLREGHENDLITDWIKAEQKAESEYWHFLNNVCTVKRYRRGSKEQENYIARRMGLMRQRIDGPFREFLKNGDTERFRKEVKAAVLAAAEEIVKTSPMRQ